MSHGGTLRNLSILLGSALLFVLSFGIFYARQIQPSIHKTLLNNSCRHFNEKWILLYQPDCTGVRSAGTGAGAPIHFNSFGFRDKERSPKRDPKIFRVALLGSSTLVGYGVPDSSSPAWLMEDLLRKRGHGNVEFLNLSVEGYNSVQHALRIDEYLDRFKPDLILIDSLHDYKIFYDYVTTTRLLHRDDAGQVIRISGTRDFLGDWLFHALANHLVIKLWLYYLSIYPRYFAASMGLRFFTPENERAATWMAPTLQWLKLIRDHASAHGAKAMALWDGRADISLRALRDIDESPLFIHFKRSFMSYHAAPETIIENVRGAGIATLDLTGKLPEMTDQDAFIGDARYYNETGMRRFAEALSQALEPYLPKPGMARQALAAGAPR